MNYSWSTVIDKFMLWRAGRWTKYGSKTSQVILRIQYDQLLITSDTKVLESLNMHSKIKGIYKEDILILISICCTNQNQELRKLKFQIKADVTECLQKLGEHFPVINHSSIQANFTSKYRTVEDIFKYALESKDNFTALPLPPAYRNFVKLCLLDPNFLQVVLETERILQEEIMKIQNPI